MRIIAGTAKGVPLATPRSGTRPMTGRARESLFSILQSTIPGARVLDLYAGSGSLGLESLSRGAASAVFVEKSRDAARVIRQNIDAVGLGGVVIERPVLAALGSVKGQFDVVFVDPPYSDEDTEVRAALAAIDRALAQDGIVVVHRQASSELLVPEFLTCSDVRRYGDAVITMMERIDQ